MNRQASTVGKTAAIMLPLSVALAALSLPWSGAVFAAPGGLPACMMKLSFRGGVEDRRKT